MELRSNSQYTFKGYDARPLKGFLMNSNCNGIANDMLKIGEKEGFKVYSANPRCYEGVPLYSDLEESFDIWSQDYWTILKDSILSLKKDFQFDNLVKYFNKKANLIQDNHRNSSEYQMVTSCIAHHGPYYHEAKINLNKLNQESHIKGGNVFIVKGEKEDEIIIGNDELKKFSMDEIKKIYSVNKVCVLPQMDYHLDLFIRPLDNKRILLADDNETLKIFDIMKKNINSDSTKISQKDKYTILSNLAKEKFNFTKETQKNPLPKADEVADILTKNGYEVIRVPGRIYKTFYSQEKQQVVLLHKANYLNANVIKNNEGDIVYITNKTNFDNLLQGDNNTIDYPDNTLQNHFMKSISPYVKKEHTYFINTDDMLTRYMGGIHCACTEIPQ